MKSLQAAGIGRQPARATISSEVEEEADEEEEERKRGSHLSAGGGGSERERRVGRGGLRVLAV